MPNINGSISIERAAKYLRTDREPEQVEVGNRLRLVGSAVVLSYGSHRITEQNPAAEALRRLTEPHTEAKKSGLKQEELLMFRLGHRELQGKSRGAKESTAKAGLSAKLNALLAAHPWKSSKAANF